MAKRKSKAESNGTAVMEPLTVPGLTYGSPKGNVETEESEGPSDVIDLEFEETEDEDAKPGLTIVYDSDAGMFVNAADKPETLIPAVREVVTAIAEEALEAIEWQKRVRAKGQEVAALKGQLSYKAEEHKEAKKAWESASTELQQLVCREPKPLPLIDGAKARAAEVATQAEKPTATVADESWRDISVDELGLTIGLTANLSEGGLTTIGKIADWSTKGKLLTDVPGVGPAAAEKIQAALDAFWQEWADDAKAAKAEPGTIVQEFPLPDDDDDEASEDGPSDLVDDDSDDE